MRGGERGREKANGKQLENTTATETNVLVGSQDEAACQPISKHLSYCSVVLYSQTAL